MREFNDLLDASSKELGLAYKTYAAEKLEGHTELAHELTATTDEGMRTILDIYSGLTGEVNAIKDGDEEAFKKVGGVEDEVRDAQSVCSEGRLNFRLGEPPEARFSAF